MITERQQEQASLYVLGALTGPEESAFEQDLSHHAQLRELVRTLRETAHLLLQAVPRHEPPADLKQRIMRHIDAVPQDTRQNQASSPETALASPSMGRESIGFAFVAAADPSGWKALPVPGAWIKLLSINHAAGYVVALGRLAPGTRYPAHTHAGSEDLYLLSGDLNVGEHAMQPGDFHHSDPGTEHGVNYSLNGCTLLAILSADHDLARFATA